MIRYFKKSYLKQLTLTLVLVLLFTSGTLPIPSLAQTAGDAGSVSDNASKAVTITRIWQSTLPYDMPFEYNVALNDTDGYAAVLQDMSLLAESLAGIYEQDGSLDFCILDMVWKGDNVTDNRLPETLSVSAGDSFPVTLTYTGTVKAPEGYAFSEEIDTGSFTYTLTLHVYETIEDLPQIPLHIPDDIAFYQGAGLPYSPEMTIEEIAAELESFGNVRFYFLTEDETVVYPSEVQWCLTDIIPGIPGTYTAEATFTVPSQYTLPVEAAPLSVPIYIRDDASLEIYLDSVYSEFWGTAYYGGVYLPKDAEAVEGYLPGYFAYCGEAKPDAACLDALTFTPVTEEDDSIYFFEVYGYGAHSEYEDASIYIDLTCTPNDEQQGWYAFYVETAGYTSNYILLNTLQPTTLVENVEGTRGGDTNSNFPDTEQESPIIGQKPTATAAPLTSVTTTYQPTLTDAPTAAPAKTGIPAITPVPEATETPSATAVPIATPLPVMAVPEPTMAPATTTVPHIEQDTADGMTLSGVRINALIQNDNALVVSKNGVTAHFSPDALRALVLAEDDFLSVSLTWPEVNVLHLEVAVNGTVPDTLPQIELTLQNHPYDAAIHWTITHESGTAISSYDKNGYRAFTTDLNGNHILPSQENPDTAFMEPAAALPIGLWIGVAVLAIATILLLYYLLHNSRRDKE